MGFEDAAVYTLGPPQVVGIYDEILHGLAKTEVQKRVPVRSASYTLVRGAADVPLTASIINFSMALQREKCPQGRAN
jgi:hypothetical protein